MVAIVCAVGAQHTWLSYSRREQAFEQRRAAAILEVIRSSLVSGADSLPPASESEARPAPPASDGGPLPRVPPPAGTAEKPWPFFFGGGKQPRGYYGGVVRTKDTASSLSTGKGTSHAMSTSAVVTGGDFRIALYSDGSVRAVYLMPDISMNYRGYAQFQFEGRYTLQDGAFRTTDLQLVNDPRTFMEWEKSLRVMRVRARYDSAADTFSDARVEIYSIKDGRWDEWTKPPGTRLEPPQKASGAASSTISGPDGTTETYSTSSGSN